MYVNLPSIAHPPHIQSAAGRSAQAAYTPLAADCQAAEQPQKGTAKQAPAVASCGLQTKPLAYRAIRPCTQALAALTAGASVVALLLLHLPSTSPAASASALLLAYILLASTWLAHHKSQNPYK